MSCPIFKFCGNFYSSYVSSAVSTTENDSVFILATTETCICMSNFILYLSSIYVLDRLDKSIPYHEYSYVQCLCYISQYVAIFLCISVTYRSMYLCTSIIYSPAQQTATHWMSLFVPKFQLVPLPLSVCYLLMANFLVAILLCLQNDISVFLKPFNELGPCHIHLLYLG